MEEDCLSEVPVEGLLRAATRLRSHLAGLVNLRIATPFSKDRDTGSEDFLQHVTGGIPDIFGISCCYK